MHFPDILTYKVRFHARYKEREAREELCKGEEGRAAHWVHSCCLPTPSSSSALVLLAHQLPAQLLLSYHGHDEEGSKPRPAILLPLCLHSCWAGPPCLAVSEVEMMEVQLAAEGKAPCSSPQSGGVWRAVQGGEWRPPYAVSIVYRMPWWTLRWVFVLPTLPFLVATTKFPFIFSHVFSHLQTSFALCHFHWSDSSGFWQSTESYIAEEATHVSHVSLLWTANPWSYSWIHLFF